MQKFYGGTEKCETAARIIQEAFRGYRMRVNFSRIRKSKTRRLTLENKFLGSETVNKKAEEPCKVEVVELELEQSYEDNVSHDVSETTSGDDVQQDQSNIDDLQDDEKNQEKEEEEEKYDSLYETSNKAFSEEEEEDPATPKADVQTHSLEFKNAPTQNEITDRILTDIAVPGIISGNNTLKRLKRRGYETILPKKGRDEKSSSCLELQDVPKLRNEGRSSLRRSLAMSSNRSNSSDTDGQPQRPHTWTRVGSELSLTSYDNDIDLESLRR